MSCPESVYIVNGVAGFAISSDITFGYTCLNDESSSGETICDWVPKDKGSLWRFEVPQEIPVDWVTDSYKFYRLYNPSYSAFAIYNDNYGSKLWIRCAHKPEGGHDISDNSYSYPLYDEWPGAYSWQLIKSKEGKYYLYNLLVKKYMATPSVTGTNECEFVSTPTLVHITPMGKCTFALSSSTDAADYMCVSPQFNTPVRSWYAGDMGAAWRFIPIGTEVDRELADLFTSIEEVTATVGSGGKIRFIPRRCQSGRRRFQIPGSRHLYHQPKEGRGSRTKVNAFLQLNLGRMSRWVLIRLLFDTRPRSLCRFISPSPKLPLRQ